MEKYRYKRIFVIVADSMGSGYMKDAARFGDEGANTLLHIGQHNTELLSIFLRKQLIHLFHLLMKKRLILYS